ncbi:MAG: trypsin-like serine protease [Fimbriimonadaceae bacterium]|nr:trypsin-like serine protease [Fimbriimonadaceae bacterium]QYK59413.1 MAG: trypsin-like serine protease [Fimbriimonadaceae bacterium]
MAAFNSPFLRSLAFGIACMGVLAQSQASTRRDDRFDSQYLSFGAQFSAVGKVNVDGSWSGSGTLVADQWVLTAAHVLDRYAGSASVELGGQSYGVVDWVVNPGWSGDLFVGNDMTLAKLDRKVTGVDPMSLFQGSAVGHEAAIVGFGGTGTGTTGWNNAYDGKRRAATNRVEGGTFSFYGAEFANTLVTDFDAPGGGTNSLASLGSSATPTELEGNVVFGDSGGALLVQQDGSWKIAGVTSWLWSLGDGPLAGYGDLSGFSAIAGQRDWILQTVPEPGTMVAISAGLAALARRRRSA